MATPLHADPAHAALVRRHLIAENAQDLPGTLATLHKDCRFEDFATGQTWLGHEGAAAHYDHWWSTFDVEVKRGEGQRNSWIGADHPDNWGYIAEATWHGKHIGPYLGIAPTGRTIVQPFVVVLSFKDGLMLSERFHYDLGSLLRQIGADPVPGLGALPWRVAA